MLTIFIEGFDILITFASLVYEASCRHFQKGKKEKSQTDWFESIDKHFLKIGDKENKDL